MRRIRALSSLGLLVRLLLFVVSSEHGTCLGSVAAARSLSAAAAAASAGAAPAASAKWSAMEARIEELVREVGCESQTPRHMPEQLAPPAGLDLRTLLEPFDAKLRLPHVKVTGAGGVPLDARAWPQSADDAIAMIEQQSAPRSIVLLLEELEAAPSPFAEMLRPFLPLTNVTAHVYISNQGASALKNHTDVTEVLVLQLLGRKEWLYCREREELVLPWLPAAAQSTCVLCTPSSRRLATTRKCEAAARPCAD